MENHDTHIAQQITGLSCNIQLVDHGAYACCQHFASLLNRFSRPVIPCDAFQYIYARRDYRFVGPSISYLLPLVPFVTPLDLDYGFVVPL